MVYNEKTADAIRKALGKNRNVTEKNMFGGIAFLLKGKMFCGVLKDDIVVRVGKENYADALKKSHARPMNFTGREIEGFVYVSPDGYKTGKALRGWLKLATEYVSSLPARKTKKKLK